jgi:hypothetical protein
VLSLGAGSHLKSIPDTIGDIAGVSSGGDIGDIAGVMSQRI